MTQRIGLATLLGLFLSVPLSAQLTRDARYEILRTVIAEQAASRIAMPFGKDGLELTDTGTVDQKKVEEEIKKNGQSIDAGKIVTITDISFDDNKIEIELDGGGKNKKSWYERIEVGTGNQTTPISRGDEEKKAKGSKIVLKFAKKVPSDLSPDQLHQLLDPVLDFNKHNFMKTGIEALPPEFQEAVKVKEARIGMDHSTVIMALGRPDKRSREKNEQGVEQETWIYFGRGMHAQFVWFQDDVVIKIAQY